MCGNVFFASRPIVNRGAAKFCGRSCASRANYQKAKLNKIGLGASGPEADNPNWKGGLTKSTRGYWYVKQRGHPQANKQGYIKRANLVYEQQIGRLHDGEIVHHVNGDKEDDRPSNLRAMTIAEHSHLHHPKTVRRRRPLQPNHPCNRRYTWPSDEELIMMWSLTSLRKLAAVIGCDFKSVDRRIKRILAKT